MLLQNIILCDKNIEKIVHDSNIKKSTFLISNHDIIPAILLNPRQILMRKKAAFVYTSIARKSNSNPVTGSFIETEMSRE